MKKRLLILGGQQYMKAAASGADHYQVGSLCSYRNERLSDRYCPIYPIAVKSL